MNTVRNNSWYFSSIRKYLFFVIISGIFALMCTLISYPGILYSDSYGRIDIAKLILSRAPRIDSWNTTVPCLFIAISLALTKGIALYTFFHAWLLFLFTFLLLIRLGLNSKLLLVVLVGLNPMIWGASVYYETGVGCVTGIVAILLILSVMSIEKSNIDRLIEFSLLTFFSFIVFGYRANAFTVFPVFLIFIVLVKCERKLKLLFISAITLGFVFVSVFTTMAHINTMSSKSAGFVWDILNVIDSLDDNEKNNLITVFDDIGGEGATKEALQMNNNNSIDGFLWESKLNRTTLSQTDAFSRILQKYISVIKHYPFEYMRVKSYSVFRSLGINKRITLHEYDYDRWGWMVKYNFSDTRLRHLFVDTYKNFVVFMGWYMLRPIVVFLISLCAVIYEYVKKNSNRSLFLFTFAISVFYYGSFLINTQAYQIRYFYPALFLLSAINIVAAINFIKMLGEKARNHFKHSKSSFED